MAEQGEKWPKCACGHPQFYDGMARGHIYGEDKCCVYRCSCTAFHAALPKPPSSAFPDSAEAEALKVALASEREKREAAEQVVKGRRGSCAWCNTTYEKGDEVVRAHISACSKHPLFAAIKRAEAAEDERDDLRKQLAAVRWEAEKNAVAAQDERERVASRDQTIERLMRLLRERDAEVERLRMTPILGLTSPLCSLCSSPADPLPFSGDRYLCHECARKPLPEFAEAPPKKRSRFWVWSAASAVAVAGAAAGASWLWLL